MFFRRFFGEKHIKPIKPSRDSLRHISDVAFQEAKLKPQFMRFFALFFCKHWRRGRQKGSVIWTAYSFATWINLATGTFANSIASIGILTGSQ